MNNDFEKFFFCKPCAEKIKTMKTCNELKYIQSVREKGTCEQCRCRRFGYICMVKFNEV